MSSYSSLTRPSLVLFSDVLFLRNFSSLHDKRLEDNESLNVAFIEINYLLTVYVPHPSMPLAQCWSPS